MKKIIVIGLVLLIAISGYYLMQSKSNNTTSENTEPKVELASSEATTVEKYSWEEIATHNSKESCWLVYGTKVYDVTPYVASGFHPGKEAILMGCGKDATELFDNRPNGSGSHSDRARAMLEKYYKGEVASE